LTCLYRGRFADHYDDSLQPMLLSAHPLAQANYGDNTWPPGFGNDNSKTIVFFDFLDLRTHVLFSTPPDTALRLPRPVHTHHLPILLSASLRLLPWETWYRRFTFHLCLFKPVSADSLPPIFFPRALAVLAHFASPDSGFFFLRFFQLPFIFSHHLHHVS
jgi:hypothetical protein